MHWKRLVPSSVRPEPQWSNVHRWRMQRWIHGVQVDTGLDTTLLCTLCPRSYDIRDGYMNFVSIYQKPIERKSKSHTPTPSSYNKKDPQLDTEITYPPNPNQLHAPPPRRQCKVGVQVDTCGTPRWIQSYRPQPPVEAERNATRA